MRVQEHAGASLAEAANDLAHVVTSDGVERARGLVEDDQRRVSEQRDAEPESLLHPLREGADPVVASLQQIDCLEGAALFLAPRCFGQREEPAVQAEHLPGGQQGLEAEQLGEISDPTPRLAVPEWGAEHERFASGGPRESQQEFHNRRLPCAVGTEKAEHLAPLHRHRQ